MELILKGKIKEAIRNIYNSEVADDQIQLQETRKDFRGDFTLVVFPLLRFSKNTPEKTAETIADLPDCEFCTDFRFQCDQGFSES